MSLKEYWNQSTTINYDFYESEIKTAMQKKSREVLFELGTHMDEEAKYKRDKLMEWCRNQGLNAEVQILDYENYVLKVYW